MNKINLCFYVIFFITSFNLIGQNLKYINGQPVILLDDLLKVRPDITYTQLSDISVLYHKKSPISDNEDNIWWEQNPVIHPKTFIVSIPHGRVHAQRSSIVVDDMYVDEFIWPLIKYKNFIAPCDNLKSKIIKIDNKVAVITQGDINNYYHWMVEILPRLALLQKSGINYDYLYLPFHKSFVQETINLLGIVDISKILKPLDNDCYIQADQLIVPSAPSAFGYSSKFVIDFLRNSFIPLAQFNIDFNKFAKKIFISRRKATSRKIINEDDVFDLFKEHGFVRYDLEDLSILEQIALFHHAECIVGEHGAGLTNIIFAQPNTKVIEIFQARQRMMFWYLGQELGLQYTCVKTIEFDAKKIGHFQSVIPLDPIKSIIKQLFD